MPLRKEVGQLFKYIEENKVIDREKEPKVDSSCPNTTQSFIRLTGLSTLLEGPSLLLRLYVQLLEPEVIKV
jgi:hypothetical protein